MSEQTMQKNGASTNRTLGKAFKFAAATAAVIIMTVFAAGTAAAANMTQNVNVVNTPAVNANATITAPGPLTNVGRLASQQVELEFMGGGCPSHVNQINVDGTRSCFDLANHPGEVLIITDLDWLGSAAPGNTCIAAVNDTTGSAFFLSVSVAGADQWASKTEHLTTGLKMSVNPQFAMDGACTLSVFQAQGYLVPNQ